MPDKVALRVWLDDEWRKRWNTAAKEQRATVWKTEWGEIPLCLYDNMTKAEATALFLMRTEIIGLNCWLASVGVPHKLPHCECGWRAQTVEHVLLHCPRYDTRGLVSLTDTENLQEMLQRPASAKAAARWLISQGVMEQFRAAAETGAKDAGAYTPFQELDEWV